MGDDFFGVLLIIPPFSCYKPIIIKPWQRYWLLTHPQSSFARWE